MWSQHFDPENQSYIVVSNQCPAVSLTVTADREGDVMALVDALNHAQAKVKRHRKSRS